MRCELYLEGEEIDASTLTEAIGARRLEDVPVFMGALNKSVQPCSMASFSSAGADGSQGCVHWIGER